MKETDLYAIEQTIEKYPWYSLAHLELFKGLSELGDEQRDAYLHKAAAYLYSRGKLYDIAFPAVSKKNIPRNDNDTSYQELEVDLIDENPSNPASSNEDKNYDGENFLVTQVSDNVSEKEGDNANEKEKEFEFVFDIEESKDIEMPCKVIITGGDYFSRNDFDTIELDDDMPLDRFIVEKPSLLRASLTSRECPTTFDRAEIDASELFDDSSFYTETLAEIYTNQGFYKRALDVYAKLILLYPEKSAYFATLVKDLKTKPNT